MKFLNLLLVVSASVGRILMNPSPPTLFKMLDMNGDGIFNEEDARHRLKIMGIRWNEQDSDIQALMELANGESWLNVDAVFDTFKKLAEKYKKMDDESL